MVGITFGAVPLFIIIEYILIFLIQSIIATCRFRFINIIRMHGVILMSSARCIRNIHNEIPKFHYYFNVIAFLFLEEFINISRCKQIWRV